MQPEQGDCDIDMREALIAAIPELEERRNTVPKLGHGSWRYYAGS